MATDTHLQDESDMARLSRGEDQALNDLMDRYAIRLFHYLIRQLRNESDAAEVAQETFVKVHRHRLRFRPGRGTFAAWLYAMATNLARDRQRWRARRPEVTLEAEEESGAPTAIPDPGRQPDRQLEHLEQGVLVREAIGALPEGLRTPLILAEYEGLSQGEIAEILGCSVKAVETRIYRARQKLRKILSPLMAQ